MGRVKMLDQVRFDIIGIEMAFNREIANLKHIS